jgi:hypothetical protein
MQLDHVLPILIFKAIYERNAPARNSAADHPFSRYASYKVALTQVISESGLNEQIQLSTRTRKKKC